MTHVQRMNLEAMLDDIANIGGDYGDGAPDSTAAAHACLDIEEIAKRALECLRQIPLDHVIQTRPGFHFFPMSDIRPERRMFDLGILSVDLYTTGRQRWVLELAGGLSFTFALNGTILRLEGWMWNSN